MYTTHSDEVEYAAYYSPSSGTIDVSHVYESGYSVYDTQPIMNVPTDEDFLSAYKPHEMRCLALVAHNHMKPAMFDFIMANKNLLKKFRLTGTKTTMSVLQSVYNNDSSAVYGPTCSSGPLGGDAELVALMCTGQLGGVMFFVDPMSAHPHAADIACLTRQAIVHNILFMNNPVSANAGAHVLRQALVEGKSDLIPSFFKTLVSPSVHEYKVQQEAILNAGLVPSMDASMHHRFTQQDIFKRQYSGC